MLSPQKMSKLFLHYENTDTDSLQMKKVHVEFLYSEQMVHYRLGKDSNLIRRVRKFGLPMFDCRSK